ncbi:Dihydropteroate synthase [Peniophora sp. CONT]|nr:Dihydropteroate synthase [Peniophora sp. CONT]
MPYAESVSINSRRLRDGARLGPDRFLLNKLACNLIVGLNPCEREDKQLVHFDVEIQRSGNVFDWRRLGQHLRKATEASSFISLEALASLAAKTSLVLAQAPAAIVTVRAGKPKAIVFAEAAEVEITRTLSDYPELRRVANKLAQPLTGNLNLAPLLRSVGHTFEVTSDKMNTVALALGSNIGDRFANIEAALQILEKWHTRFSGGPGATIEFHVVDTSFMYETEPMYVTDQPKFANCAVMVRTNFGTHSLLLTLQMLESQMGRVKGKRNGPRPVDLDILLYNDEIIDTRAPQSRLTLDNLSEQLVIPHPRMAEREFVLRPLCDMVPDWIHPVLKRPMKDLLADVMKTKPADEPPMARVMPFPATSGIHNPPIPAYPQYRATATHWVFPAKGSPAPHKTRLMATLNATPDSFSDGGSHNATSSALEYASKSVAAGAAIIDVGGYSTRPGADFVSDEEETRRVVSTIEALRESGDIAVSETPISVDTFRASVARAALEAGANCINDVYAFTGPEYPLTKSSATMLREMRALAHEFAVPVVLMHSRGPAGENKDYSQYSSVLEGVARELSEKIDAIVRGPGGVRRWLVIVDPGVGFSKTIDGNIELLRRARELTEDELPGGTLNSLRGFPQLIGASRKSFLGKILEEADEHSAYKGRETAASERDAATAAAVSTAVQQGAEIIRVHDVQMLGDVVRVADRLWK